VPISNYITTLSVTLDSNLTLNKHVFSVCILVGVCNEFRSLSAYWPATAIRYCADQSQTPEVVWPRGITNNTFLLETQCSRITHAHVLQIFYPTWVWDLLAKKMFKT